ncbi:thioredoxin family protein [Aureibacter tunicatorum]|uniref:Thioredoxin-related protein n=1 Tax=Aureibacter tunicatorum TaxID=866807 RepID=A0AAE4BQ85_9BACT|nr:thioredoxin family protein [Aureibacter tunicatorum]MDR6237296.1 thioredoxin-related protein [Aureibacter tunicatorum]BDD06287.1 hypothetical protein AUTU_37700 [Aureibacter tunicatorum]
MKTSSLVILLLFLSVSAFSQEWLTDFEEAKKLSKQTNKPIVLVFQGSDWSAPCIKLERSIWSSSDFKSYADKHFIMLKADFPRKKKNQLSLNQQNHNNELAKSYNKAGYFPLVVVLDKEGSVLNTLGYSKLSPKEYIKSIESYKND